MDRERRGVVGVGGAARARAEQSEEKCCGCPRVTRVSPRSGPLPINYLPIVTACSSRPNVRSSGELRTLCTSS